MVLKYNAVVALEGEDFTANVAELNAHTWGSAASLEASTIEAIQVALDTDEEVEVTFVDENGEPFKFTSEFDTIAEMRGDA